MDAAAALMPEGVPAALRHDAIRGRHLVASRAIHTDEVLLESPAFLTAVLPTHRKRVCSHCLRDKRTRLNTACSGCLYTHYCDSTCQAAHLHGTPPAGPLTTTPAGGADSTPESAVPTPHCDLTPAANLQPSMAAPGSSCAATLHPPTHAAAPQPPALPIHRAGSYRAVPHRLVCAVIKQFSAFKQDADMQAILLMCLEALGRQHILASVATTGTAVPATGTPLQPQQDRTPDPSTPAAHAAQDLQCSDSDSAAQALHSSDSDSAVQALTQVAGGGADQGVHVSTTDTQPQEMSEGLVGQLHECQQGQGTAAQPMLVPGDLLLLVGHMGHQPLKERQEWVRGARFLITCMQRAGWPGPLPSQDLLVDLCGRVLANNFGIFAPQHQHLARPPKEEEGAAAVHTLSPALAPLPAEACGALASLVDTLPRMHLSAPSSPHLRDTPGAADGGLLPTQGAAEGGLLLQAPALGGSDDVLLRAQELEGGRSCLQQSHQVEGGGPPMQQGHQVEGGNSPPMHSLQQDQQGAVAAGLSSPQGAVPSLPEPGLQGAGDVGSSEPRAHGAGASDAPDAAEPDHHGAAAPRLGGKDEMTGRQVFITASFFNHSCSPNSCVQLGTSSGDALVVRALRDIPEGEELCIAYIDLDLPRATRQAQLLKLFNFRCTCTRCEEELLHPGSGDKMSWARSVQSGRAAAAAARTRAGEVHGREKQKKGGGHKGGGCSHGAKKQRNRNKE